MRTMFLKVTSVAKLKISKFGGEILAPPRSFALRLMKVTFTSLRSLISLEKLRA